MGSGWRCLTPHVRDGWIGVLLLPTLYFTYGRAAWLALAAGLAAAVAADPRRLQLIATMLAIAPGGSSRAAEPASVPPDHARRMRVGLALFKESVRPALIRRKIKTCPPGLYHQLSFPPC